MDLILVLIVFVVSLVVALVLVDSRNKGKPDFKAAKSYPGPHFYPVIGSLLDVIFMNPEQTFKYARELAKKFQKSYRQYVIGHVILNVIRAKDVEKLLVSSKHSNKSLIYSFLKPFLGEGLLISKGLKWQHRRKILTPAFHFNILTQFLGVFRDESDKLIRALQKEVNNKVGTDVIPISTQFTLNTICETAMGIVLDKTSEGDNYRKNIYGIGEEIVHRMLRPWLHHKVIFKVLGYKKKLEKLVVPVHSFTRNIINLRRSRFFEQESMEEKIDVEDNIYESKKQRFAMLDTLLAAEKEGYINQQGIQEEVDTFMFEGHDTTSVALTFTLLLLGHHPEVQDKILNEFYEVQEEIGLEDFCVSDYNKLKYLDRVIKESLRLYPSVSFISRSLTEDLELDGVTFPKRSMAFVHIYDLHRDPEQFPDPEKFDPDRFLPENVAKRHPFAYIPFSAGMRNCIGQKFAILELKTVVIEILRKYKLLSLTKREDVVFVADLVLRSKNAIKIKFSMRDTSE